MNFGQAAVGLIVLLVVVGGFLYLYYSRTNAVEKNGYGAVIMLSIVSLMIPFFWIVESNNQTSETVKQFNESIQRGMVDYAQNCNYHCYGIIGTGDQAQTVIPTANGYTPGAKYNGYNFDDLNQMLDPAVTRIISAGEFAPGLQPGTPEMPNDNTIPRSSQYGGALSSNDVSDILNFIRSHSADYRNKHGYPHDQLLDLPKYLAGSAPTQYDAAVTYAKEGQFGPQQDHSDQQNVAISIVDPGGGVSCGSPDGCFTPANIVVKVGTTITWTNKSSVPHTVTASDGQDLAHPKPPATQIFDSSSQYAGGQIATGQEFTYTVTMDAYNFNSTTHEIVYYCSIHPTMLAKLKIVLA